MILKVEDLIVEKHISGYYADIEARCQVFRVCANTDLTGKGIFQHT